MKNDVLTYNNSHLLQAVKDNDIDNLKLILQQGNIDINYVHEYEYFIQEDISDDENELDGMAPPMELDDLTAIEIATKNGHFELVKLLFENGALINGVPDHDRFPLEEAIEGGHAEIVRFFLLNGADLELISAELDYESIQFNGHHEVTKLLMQFSGITASTTIPLPHDNISGNLDENSRNEAINRFEEIINRSEDADQYGFDAALEVIEKVQSMIKGSNSELDKYLFRSLLLSDELQDMMWTVGSFYDRKPEMLFKTNQDGDLDDILELDNDKIDDWIKNAFLVQEDEYINNNINSQNFSEILTRLTMKIEEYIEDNKNDFVYHDEFIDHLKDISRGNSTKEFLKNCYYSQTIFPQDGNLNKDLEGNIVEFANDIALDNNKTELDKIINLLKVLHVKNNKAGPSVLNQEEKQTGDENKSEEEPSSSPQRNNKKIKGDNNSPLREGEVSISR